MDNVVQIIKTCKNFGIRCRISFLDFYNHIGKRFENKNIDISEDYKRETGLPSFHLPLNMRENTLKLMKRVADSINGLMEGRFSRYSVSANPIVMDSNGNDWDFFDIPDASWEAGFYAKHLHFTDKKAFFQDTGSLCSEDEDLATREDFLNKINELREAGGQLAMMIAITVEA